MTTETIARFVFAAFAVHFVAEVARMLMAPSSPEDMAAQVQAIDNAIKLAASFVTHVSAAAMVAVLLGCVAIVIKKLLAPVDTSPPHD